MSSLRHGDQQSFKDGAKTLIRHGTHGLSNTISKVTSSASRGLASVDTDFLRQREEQNDYKDRPEDYKVGFKQGTSHFVKCVSSGLSGAVSKPAQGYSTGGFKGLAQVLCDLDLRHAAARFATHRQQHSDLCPDVMDTQLLSDGCAHWQGMAFGMAGLICKPASGLLDLVANTTEGIRNQTNPQGRRQIARFREPRTISSDRVVLPLHSTPPPYLELLSRLALESTTLPVQALGGDLGGDSYFGHFVLAHGVLLFTDCHCIFAETRAIAPSAKTALGAGDEPKGSLPSQCAPAAGVEGLASTPERCSDDNSRAQAPVPGQAHDGLNAHLTHEYIMRSHPLPFACTPAIARTHMRSCAGACT